MDKNRFTMPFDNVTIEARWGLDIPNPNTKTGIVCILIILIGIGIGSFFYEKKRLKKIN